MSNFWCDVDSQLLNEATVQLLPPDVFKTEFIKAIRGNDTVFADWVRGPFNRPTGQEWDTLKLQVFERDRFTCTYCGQRGGALECDHVIPVARGGSSDADNLTTACRHCNRSKGSKLISEWKQ